jgi:diguanylate cyclase
MRHGLPLCLLYMDLNNFKTLNDTEGHNAGDKVLENVGSILTTVMREVDICCRFGGDEFCVIMPRTTMEQAATPLKRLMEAFAPADHSNVSFSMGLAQTGANGKLIDADTLVHTADQAMYKAKAEAKSLNREQPPHTIQNQIVDTLPVE